MPAAPTTVPMGPPPQQAPQQAQPPQQQRGMTDADKARISRLAASGTAFEFVGQIYAGLGDEALSEAVKHARLITDEILRHGWTGSFEELAQQAQASAPSTPQEVAAQVNAQVGEEAVQVSVPWDTPTQA